MRRLVSTLLLLLCFSSATASDLFAQNAGGFLTGNGLHGLCESAKSADLANCDGYIMGVADLANGLNGVNVCIPHAATAEEVRDVVKKYLVDHPDERHFTAYSTVVVALVHSFACPTPTHTNPPPS